MMTDEQRLINYLVDNVVDFAAVGKKLAKENPKLFLAVVDGELEIQRAAVKYANILLALRDGQTVNAIKHLRNMTNLGLKEAKDVLYVVLGRAEANNIGPKVEYPIYDRKRFIDGHSEAEAAVARQGHRDLAEAIWGAYKAAV